MNIFATKYLLDVVGKAVGKLLDVPNICPKGVEEGRCQVAGDATKTFFEVVNHGSGVDGNDWQEAVTLKCELS